MQIPVKKTENPELKFMKPPVLLYAGQISDEPDWSFPNHKHDDLSEIIYICKGEGDFIIGNMPYHAGKGDILIYNRGMLHEERSDPQNPLKMYFCGIGDITMEGIAEGCIIPDYAAPVIHSGIYMQKMENYISDIFTECFFQEEGFDIICRNCLVSMIVIISRLTVGWADSPGNILQSDSLGKKVKDYIDRNYAMDISLDEIAGNLYISRHYLSHIFKKEIGHSPINYMINRRMGEAEKLLLTTDMTVREIAFNVGYSNTNYFTMLFKKVTGLTPIAFKKNYLK